MLQISSSRFAISDLCMRALLTFISTKLYVILHTPQHNLPQLIWQKNLEWRKMQENARKRAFEIVMWMCVTYRVLKRCIPGSAGWVGYDPAGEHVPALAARWACCLAGHSPPLCLMFQHSPQRIVLEPQRLGLRQAAQSTLSCLDISNTVSNTYRMHAPVNEPSWNETLWRASYERAHSLKMSWKLRAWHARVNSELIHQTDTEE